jgi:hypothetical protein
MSVGCNFFPWVIAGLSREGRGKGSHALFDNFHNVFTVLSVKSIKALEHLPIYSPNVFRASLFLSNLLN